jgi:hypothetical protein
MFKRYRIDLLYILYHTTIFDVKAWKGEKSHAMITRELPPLLMNLGSICLTERSYYNPTFHTHLSNKTYSA